MKPLKFLDYEPGADLTGTHIYPSRIMSPEEVTGATSKLAS